MNELLVLLTALGDRLTDLEEQYPWLTPVSELAGIGAVAVAVIAWFRRRLVGKAYRIRREVEEKNERLEADLEARRLEIKLLKERLPEAAWDLANRERTVGNEESAVRALRRHMGTEGARLSEMARQIARFHLGLVSDRDRDRHLVTAERFALLAFHLDPRHGEAGELLKEIRQLRGDPPFEHVQFTDDVFMPEELADGYYGLPQTPDAVASLLHDAEKAIRRGHYHHALALADIAFLSARRWSLGDREPAALRARYWRAMALQRLGHYDQALAEIDGTEEQPGILSVQQQKFGVTHLLALSTRSLRGAILNDLGFHKESEQELRFVVTAQDAALGPAHDSTLKTGHRLAITLAALGWSDDAKELLRTVIAGCRDGLGEEHPDTQTAIADLEGLSQRKGPIR
jgi:hypothetical protein